MADRRMNPIVVAIDGPAGSGKSSVSKEVARRLGFGYLDTGAAYRALCLVGTERGTDPADAESLASLLASFDYHTTTDPDAFSASVGEIDVTSAIRDPAISARVSEFSSRPAVRSFMNDELFPALMRTDPHEGILVEGRDITTVVAPWAPVRLLLTASEAVRQARRAKELGATSSVSSDVRASTAENEVAAQLSERDRTDLEVVDFLHPADGVELVDSTDLTFDETVERIIAIIREQQAALAADDDATASTMRAGLEHYELEEEDLGLLDAAEEDEPEELSHAAPPVLAIIGRPNVGKSTLVNRIIGRREAVVEDTPGVTRDRVTYHAEWNGQPFTMVDTGGWEFDARGIDASVANQAEIAARESDAVLFVVDAAVGATASDEHVVRMLRKAKKPVILVANKADDARAESMVPELWGLGFGEPHPVSALHGRGTGDLLDIIVETLPKESAVAPAEVGGPRRVAIVGRPNVGKSSLLNKAVGEQRVVVNDLAGTTRDPVDEQVEILGRVWRFIDTAGIRRRVHLQQGSDFYASLRTSAAIDRAEVAVVVFDVTEPISEQDVRIVDMVLESGRALVLAFNKWDLIDDDRRRYLEREIEQDLAHVAWAPRVNLSALTGRHLEKLVPALESALEGWDTRIPTGKLNAFLQELAQAQPHPVRGGKQPRILFGTQASSRPPKFVLFTTGFLDPGYRRFIMRRLRETYGFIGTPIELSMRVRERRGRAK